MQSISVYHRIRAALHILLVQSLMPITLTYMVVEAIRSFLRGTMNDAAMNETETSSNESNKNDVTKNFTVVLTGGKMSKTLHLCRCLRQYADSSANKNLDLKIVVLEQRKFRWNATAFSKCVDVFVPITSPRESPSAYKQDIINACMEHKATHFLPVAAPVEAVYDADLKQILEHGVGTKSLHMDHELCGILDDKHKFGCFLQDTLQITSLRTHQVSTDDQVRQYNAMFRQEAQTGKLKRTMILKNLAYDPIHRLDLFQLPCSDDDLNAYLSKIRRDGNAISEDQPWQLQEFLRDGVEYAAMIVVRDNRMLALTCAASSASQLNYIHIEVPAIRAWVEDFMKSLQNKQTKYTLTGQLCFDFMVVKEDNGQEVAYPIECNPRVHTQCTIYNSDPARALFGSLLLESSSDNLDKSAATQERLVEQLELEYPLVNKHPKEIYWFYNEFFKIFPNNWLLKYNDNKDAMRRSKMLLQPLPRWTLTQFLVLGLYLPSMILSMVLAAPVLLCFALVSMMGTSHPNDLPAGKAKDDNDHVKLTRWEHAYVIMLEASNFVQRRLVDSAHNIEADWWKRDPLPLFIKNHVQVIVRLLASLRTGVEWKKIDFAIGKVVEVGGD